jgi:hypothetical protein
MADWQGGLSGAASGAAAGSAFGPWGTAIGGAVGGIAGLFGGGGGADDQLDETEDRNKRLASRLRGMYQDAEDKNASNTQFYAQGMAQAREQTEGQATRDASQAAARGLSGSEFELAQDANRQEALAQTQRNLLTNSEQQLQQERARLFRSWLNRESELNDIQLQRAGYQANQRQQGNQMLMNSLQTAGQVFGGMSGGGGSSG